MTNGLRRAPWTRFGLRAILLSVVLEIPSASDSGPALLERVASWPGFGRGPAADIAISGDHAFVAIEQGGLLILDITDPSAPVRVGAYPLPGRTQLIRVSGQRAYVAGRVSPERGWKTYGWSIWERWQGSLRVLDISDPAHPSVLGSYTTSEGIRSLWVEGDRVYLCDGDEMSYGADGLHILDVSDPARPRALSVGQPAACRDIRALLADGPRLYCGGSEQWHIADVSQPASPKLINSPETDTPVRGMSALERLVLIARGEFAQGEFGPVRRGSLTVLEKDPAGELVLQAKLDLGCVALGVAAAGTTAYIAAGPDGLLAVDISDPARPTLVGKFDTPGMAVTVTLAGTHAWVADYHGGIQVIDVEHPARMTLVSRFDTGVTTRKLRVSGEKFWLINSDTHPEFLNGIEGRSRLEILDLKNPVQPVLLGAYEMPEVMMDLSVAGDLVCIGFNRRNQAGENSKWIRLLDFSQPSQPVDLSDIHLGDSGVWSLSVQMTNQYAFVGCLSDEHSLQVFELKDLASPVRVGQGGDSDITQEMRVIGDRVYLQNVQGLKVIDIADVHQPRLLGSVGFGSSWCDV